MAKSEALSIVQPSFWSSAREVRNASGALVGRYAPTSFFGSQAEGNIAGRRFHFSTRGWEGTRAEMKEAGQVIARMSPTSFWGSSYEMEYAGKNYAWKPNTWKSAFSLLDSEKRIVHVRNGSYFAQGSITPESDIPERDVLPLALFGFFCMQIFMAQMAATSSAAT